MSPRRASTARGAPRTWPAALAAGLLALACAPAALAQEDADDGPVRFDYETPAIEPEPRREPPPRTGFYYRFGVGAMDRRGATFEGLPGPDPTRADFDDPHLLVSLAFGDRVGLARIGRDPAGVGLRVEVEGVFAFGDYDRADPRTGVPRGDGQLFEYGFTVNVLPDVRLGRVSIFGGGGIGASLFSFNDSEENDFGTSRGALVLQALGGASVDVSYAATLYGLIRYRTYSDAIWREGGDRLELDDLRATAFEFGVMYRF